MSEIGLEFSREVFPEAPVRAEDLRYIVSCIQQGECCSVVGPSNTGKSILLKSLLAEEVRQSCAHEGAAPPLMIFVDCLAAGDTEQGFYELVLRRILEELEGSGASRATIKTLRTLHRQVLRYTSDEAVRSLFASSMRELYREPGIRVVLILDEFDDVFHTLPPWPFRQLRALRDRFGVRLCYVVATSRHLERLRSDVETYEFRELFHPYTRVLCPLCQEDTRCFIAYLAKKHGMILDEERTSLAIDLSGGHPGFLTHICRILSTWEVEPLPQRQTIVAELSRDQVIQEECRRLWAELEEEELEGLLTLVGRGEAALDAEHRQSLEAKGLVRVREDGNLGVFSSIFEAFVKDELATRQLVAVKGFYCDLETRRVWVDGREVTWQLSELQRELVLLLYQKEGQLCTYAEIGEKLYWDESVKTPRIRQLVARIYEKIPESRRYILIVPREGYRMETPE